jgi:hypothetical protein
MEYTNKIINIVKNFIQPDIYSKYSNKENFYTGDLKSAILKIDLLKSEIKNPFNIINITLSAEQILNII